VFVVSLWLSNNIDPAERVCGAVRGDTPLKTKPTQKSQDETLVKNKEKAGGDVTRGVGGFVLLCGWV